MLSLKIIYLLKISSLLKRRDLSKTQVYFLERVGSFMITTTKKEIKLKKELFYLEEYYSVEKYGEIQI